MEVGFMLYVCTIVSSVKSYGGLDGKMLSV